MDFRLELRRTSKLVVASPKGDLVSVSLLSRHSRAGLWILPSLAGLVCGRTGCGTLLDGFRNGPLRRSKVIQSSFVAQRHHGLHARSTPCGQR